VDPAVAFGVVLRTLRKQAKLSQEQLALEAEIQRNFVSLMERGVNQPTVRMLFKLSKALGSSPSAMLALVEAKLVENSTAPPGN